MQFEIDDEEIRQLVVELASARIADAVIKDPRAMASVQDRMFAILQTTYKSHMDGLVATARTRVENEVERLADATINGFAGSVHKMISDHVARLWNSHSGKVSQQMQLIGKRQIQEALTTLTREVLGPQIKALIDILPHRPGANDETEPPPSPTETGTDE